MAINDQIFEPLPAEVNEISRDNHNSIPEPLWTVEDVADYLKLQPETIRAMARRSELPAIKIGKVWRFQKHAIDELLVSMY